ncbi:hypothetical protein LTR97_004610 [Elasticomyces elasticus]|uniref:Uncharacterized protein n=1 Tax=Elasticomyces elasticus TaxID=574655 RepID=A0AAN7W7M2_9PEZI|nr:hypothetical protein LTR97_004610 [Elasticomyces elasticus]
MADRRTVNDSKPGLNFRDVSTIILSFLNAAIAITIIALAADSIAWARGRGSEDSETAYAVVVGPALHGNYTSDTWFTRMHYLPQYYDTRTFSALVAAGAVCVFAGLIAGSLSITSSWKGRKAPPRTILLSCLALEALSFLASVIALIYARELYSTDPVYDGDSYNNDDPYRILPKYFEPALPSNSSIRDDVIRYYRSPMHYNPMNWNCRFQGHISSAMQNRVFSLCQEGIVARGLFPALVGLQGVILLSRIWAWFAGGGKSGQSEAGSESAEADERVRRLQEEE